jgi:hypothetical protein
MMKFNLLTVLLACMIIGTASAQNVNIGIKGGLNLYTIAGDGDEGNDYKPSFHIGLLGHIHMSDNFALQPELVFSAQGAKYGDDQKLDLNYLNVPVMFQYMFDNGFRLQAGPQVGFLLSAEADGNDVKDNLNGTDLGLGIGMGYVNPESNFGFDLRYNHGLSNINENDNFDSFNRGFQLGVFYLFKHRN